eukprot:1137662-Pelagomonas_calceolata.AAC.10
MPWQNALTMPSMFTSSYTQDHYVINLNNCHHGAGWTDPTPYGKLSWSCRRRERAPCTWGMCVPQRQGACLFASVCVCDQIANEDFKKESSCFQVVVPLDGRTPLHVASRKGHVEILKALLAQGASMFHEDKVCHLEKLVKFNGSPRQKNCENKAQISDPAH